VSVETRLIDGVVCPLFRCDHEGCHEEAVSGTSKPPEGWEQHLTGHGIATLCPLHRPGP
jgi:hypothetical protein